MEKNKDIKRISKTFLGKKTKNKNKLIKKKAVLRKKLKGSIIFENSTDLSSYNLIGIEEKSDINTKVPNLDEVIIPSFFNDITKYNDINKRIKNYHEIERSLGSPELAKIYLIDIKYLYQEKNNN